MKNSFENKLYLLFIVLSLFFISACKQKYDDLAQPTAETPQKPWMPHPSVLYENFNCEAAWADSSKMYVVGRQYFMEFDSLHRLVRKVKYQTDSFFEVYYEKPYIDNHFFVHIPENQSHHSINKFVIRSVENLALTDTVWLSKDLPFSNVSYRNLYTNDSKYPFCKIIGNRLIALLSTSFTTPIAIIYNIRKTTNSLKLDYQGHILLNSSNPGFNVAVISGIHQLNDEELYLSGYVSILLNLRTQQIQELNITNRFPQIGKINDTLYFIDLSTNITVTTLVNGQASTTIFPKNPFYSSKLFFIGNECLAAPYSDRKIYDIKFTQFNNKMQMDYKTIDNFGLSDIQQLIRFKDRIYVISVNGLYYKPFSEFRVYK